MPSAYRRRPSELRQRLQQRLAVALAEDPSDPLDLDQLLEAGRFGSQHPHERRVGRDRVRRLAFATPQTPRLELLELPLLRWVERDFLRRFDRARRGGAVFSTE